MVSFDATPNGFSQPPPSNTLHLNLFKATISDSDLDYFNNLLSASILPLPTNNKYTFLSTLKEAWLTPSSSPRAHLDNINAFPNYMTKIDELDIHFTALFSSSVTATPLLLLHNFPTSPHYFIPILRLLLEKYPNSRDLPYHIIIPSLPGYAYSSTVPNNFTMAQCATTVDSLMVGLFGAETKYIAQGGDLGSFVTRELLRLETGRCEAGHVTMMTPPPGAMEEVAMAAAKGNEDSSLDCQRQEELKCLNRVTAFQKPNGAMLGLLSSQPELIGAMLTASPLALAAWVGHVMCEWAGCDFATDMELILETASVCWITGMYTRGLWHSRALAEEGLEGQGFISKPVGYSLFGGEIVPVPKTWAEKQCNLIFFNKHEAGGHFAALQRPQELLKDLEAFVSIVKACEKKPMV